MNIKNILSFNCSSNLSENGQKTLASIMKTTREKLRYEVVGFQTASHDTIIIPRFAMVDIDYDSYLLSVVRHSDLEEPRLGWFLVLENSATEERFHISLELLHQLGVVNMS